VIGNSQLPGVATEPRHMARAITAEVIEDLEDAMHFAAEACIAGEYEETLLSAWLWSIEKAAALLAPLERHLRVVA
jgi:hypothetical protein